MSDPRVDAAFAAGRVPEGVSKAYLNESRDQPSIAGIIFVTVLSSIIVLSRLASRAFLVKRFGFDDALTLLSWVNPPSTTYTALLSLNTYMKFPLLTPTALLHPLCRPLHQTHRNRLRPPLRIHPIRNAHADRRAERNPRLRRAHHLHDRFTLLPHLRPGILLPRVQRAPRVARLHPRRLRHPHRGIPPAAAPDCLPLHACYGAVAV